MANTINDLYLKYVNKVGKTLENDRYFRYLFEMVQAGNTTLAQNHRILHKVVDERWLSVIEGSLDALTRITDKPRRFITSTEEVVPVALAKKITADSVRHLSMNTQFIASSENGDIQPIRVLNVTTEETYDLYENRFVYYLIQRLVTFIDKRTDVIFWSTGDETTNTLKMESKVDDAYEQIEYKLEMTVKNRQSFAENDSDNMQVFMRIDRVRRMVMALRNSSFCEIMAGCSRVASPIQRTNLLTKNPDYRTCLQLWQFLESYDEVGYTIDEQDRALEFDEEYVLQLYSNLITNYTVFKSILESDSRNLAEIPPKRRRVIKPKFLKKIEEEIVDDYNIPDVEVRKVIIEEVTQAQLDAEARLAEETVLRQAAEAEKADAEQALTEYRWQMQFQQSEAERQAEERLNDVKAKAEEEKKALQAAIEQEKQAAEAKLQEAETAAEAREAALQAAMEQEKQAAAEKLQEVESEAKAREAALQAAMEQEKQAAAEKLQEVENEAKAREAALQATMEQEQQAAAEKLQEAEIAAKAREAALQAAAEQEKQAAAEKLQEVENEAKAREAALQAAMEQEQQAAAEKLQEAETAAEAREAALQATMEQEQQAAAEKLQEAETAAKTREAALQAAVEQAKQEAEERLAQSKTVETALEEARAALKAALEERDNAVSMQKEAQNRAEKEAKRRAAAEAKARENRLSRRIFNAITQRQKETENRNENPNSKE